MPFHQRSTLNEGQWSTNVASGPTTSASPGYLLEMPIVGL